MKKPQRDVERGMGVERWDELIERLPDDNDEALYLIYEHYREVLLETSESDRHSMVLTAYGLLRAFCQSRDMEEPTVEISGNPEEDRQAIEQFIVSIRDGMGPRVQARRARLYADSHVTKARDHFSGKLGKVLVYEFSDRDFQRVQELINELRDAISGSEVIVGDHRRRLLARLEKLQAELHKTMSNLDRFWGLIGEAGMVMGKFGEDVKPIVDRIRELVRIVWQTQCRGEGLQRLPPPGNLLTAGGENDPEPS